MRSFFSKTSSTLFHPLPPSSKDLNASRFLAMLRSQLSRSLQSLTSLSSRRSIASLPRRSPQIPQLSRASLPQVPPRIPRRWVTTEAEAKSEGDRTATEVSEAEKQDTSATQPQSDENPLQKELEAKTREVIDLKVRILQHSRNLRTT